MDYYVTICFLLNFQPATNWLYQLYEYCRSNQNENSLKLHKVITLDPKLCLKSLILTKIQVLGAEGWVVGSSKNKTTFNKADLNGRQLQPGLHLKVAYNAPNAKMMLQNCICCHNSYFMVHLGHPHAVVSLNHSRGLQKFALKLTRQESRKEPNI